MKEKEKLTTDTDVDALDRCRKGDVNAFEEIVLKYQKKMFNISFRIVGDHHEAAEVVQDAFVSAYRNIKKFRGTSMFSTWLISIVINLSRNRIRQISARSAREVRSLDDPVQTRHGEVTGEHASSDPSVLDRLEALEVQRVVQKCIHALDTEYREVLVLRDIQGFSYEETGNLLQVAAGTVKSRIHRAREALRKCLKQALRELA